MNHFFEKRDPWGHGMALWVLLAMLFLAPVAWWSIRQIHLENDVANWLPADDPSARVLSWYHEHFPADDSILASWEGSSLSDPRVSALADRLRGRPDADGVFRGGVPYVKQVVTPHQIISRMTRRGVSRDEAVKRLQGVLVGRGMICVNLTGAGRDRRRHTINRLLERADKELGIQLDVAIADESTAMTIDAADDQLASDLDAGSEPIAVMPPHDFRIGWKNMHSRPGEVERVMELARSLCCRDGTGRAAGEPLVDDCFLMPAAPVALLITLSEAGADDGQAAIASIRAAAAEVGIDNSLLHLGGRPIARSALNRGVKKAAWNPNSPLTAFYRRSPLMMSGIVSMLLAFVMLRSFRMATVVLIVTCYTTFLTVALVPITGGSMNMVLVVMPTLLLVLTLSAAIHMANYWKYAARKDLRSAVVEATRMARQPCTLASVTTAIGLLSLATSPLKPVRDFGLYAAVGCLLSLAMVLYVLPAMLQFWPARRPRETVADRTAVWNRMGDFLSRHRTAVTAISLVCLVAGAYGLTRFRTETKVIRYFPDQADVVQDYNFLERYLAGVVPVETVIRFDVNEQQQLNFLERLEIVREIENRVREHPEISGAISLADFQPSYQPLSSTASLPRRLLHNKKLRQIEKRARMEGERARSFLAVAADPADLSNQGDELLNKTGDELWRISAQVSILSDLDYGQLTRDLDEIAQSSLQRHAGAGHVVTGMVPLFLRTQQAVLDSLIYSFGLAFLVICVMMMILLRSPLAGMMTMLPNLLPVGLVFGLISWCGIAVDIGTMITASVALGISVDGTLHLLTWFRGGIERGMSRRVAVSHALVHAGPAMWQTSAVVGMGLLMLAPTELLLVSRFGWLMAALIGAALVADLVFLPALLAGPLGALIVKTAARRQAAAARLSIAVPDPTVAAREAPIPHPHLRVVSPASPVQVD